MQLFHWPKEDDDYKCDAAMWYWGERSLGCPNTWMGTVAQSVYQHTLWNTYEYG